MPLRLRDDEIERQRVHLLGPGALENLVQGERGLFTRLRELDICHGPGALGADREDLIHRAKRKAAERTDELLAVLVGALLHLPTNIGAPSGRGKLGTQPGGHGQAVRELIQSSISFVPSGSAMLTATGGMRLESVAWSRSDTMLSCGAPGAISWVAVPTMPCVLVALQVLVSCSDLA